VKVTIEHTTPYDRKYVKEIVVLNNGAEPVNEIVVSLPEFLNGLQVIDEDNSMLSFYSNDEIRNNIMNYDLDLHNRITQQLEELYLLWIRLPDDNKIQPNEIRTIRLVYSDAGDVEKVRTSIFDIPKYDDNIYSPEFHMEQYYFISAPKDFVIEVITTETVAYTVPLQDDQMPEKIEIKYLKDPSSTTDFKGQCIDIRNHDSFVTARFPNRDTPYSLKLFYQIKLPKTERYVWRTVLPVVGVMLAYLAFVPFLPFPPPTFLSSSTLLAIGGAVSSVSGALIALISNPLIRRTRLFLFIHLGLSILIMLGSGFVHDVHTQVLVQNSTSLK